MRLQRTALIRSIALLLIFFLFLPPLPISSSDTYVRVGVEYKTPPFQFMDGNGEIVGLHIDMMNSLAQKENLLIEYVPFERVSELLKELEKGSIDIALGIYSRDYSAQGLTEAAELSTANISMIVAKKNFTSVFGADDHTRYRGAFELGSIGFSKALSFNRMSTIVMGSQMQLFEALTQGRVDAILGIKESILYMLDQAELNEEYAITSNYLSSVHFALLTRQNDRVLSSALSRGMDRLRRSEEYEEILSRWIVNRDLEAARTKYQRIMRVVPIFIGVSVAALLIVTYLNSLLKRSVEEKTREIAKQLKEIEFESSLRNKVIESSPEGIMLLRPDGVVLLMNPQAKLLAGVSSLPESLHISQLPVFRDAWKERSAISSGSMSPRNLRWISPGKTEHVFRYQFHTLGAEQDIVLMIQDVTMEEKEKMDAFEADKSRSLNRIVAGISHEIKNPLTSIRAYSSLISSQGSEKDFQESFAYHVPREVDRINRLIETLINYARPARGNRENVSLKSLIEDCMYLVEVASLNHRIRFSSVIPENLTIFGNRHQMLQVLINLFMNSIDAIRERVEAFPEDKETVYSIRVQARESGPEIQLEIIDEGMGMSEEELEECTEPFFTTKAHGTGMGLSLCKQFVQENNGTLIVQSKRNVGTWITIIFHGKEAE